MSADCPNPTSGAGSDEQPGTYFLVIAFRHGGNGNVFPIGVFTAYPAALAAAARHYRYRGGKYWHRVYPFRPDVFNDDLGQSVNKTPCIEEAP